MTERAGRQLREYPAEAYHHVVLSWEEKRQHDPFLVWDRSYRWFRSPNVVPLERYRTSKEIDRIRENVLRKRWIGAG